MTAGQLQPFQVDTMSQSHHVDRRAFLAGLAGSVTVLGASAAADRPAPGVRRGAPRITFSVIGLNHAHISGMTDAVTRGGGDLVAVYAKEPDLAAGFVKKYPQAKLAGSEKEILESNVQLILSAGIPDERAPLGIRVMQHGKDYLSDKPGITSLEQLAEVRRVQAATKRIYSILYSERHEVRAAIKAGELVQAGAVGRVVQTVNLAPHRIGNVAGGARPDWFWHKARYGGILVDIGSHQADQFLFYTGSTSAEVVSSQVANIAHKDKPEFEDFGDMVLRGDGGTGYVRLDWFTPDGLSTWGDGRLTILGTEGYIELRKYVDIAGRPGGDHLFLVDQKQTRYIDCKDVELPFGPRLVSDVQNRTETAMPQAHTFLTMEVVLKAQKQARTMTLKG
jgi:predicted dehydrogenase